MKKHIDDRTLDPSSGGYETRIKMTSSQHDNVYIITVKSTVAATSPGFEPAPNSDEVPARTRPNHHATSQLPVYCRTRPGDGLQSELQSQASAAAAVAAAGHQHRQSSRHQQQQQPRRTPVGGPTIMAVSAALQRARPHPPFTVHVGSAPRSSRSRSRSRGGPVNADGADPRDADYSLAPPDGAGDNGAASDGRYDIDEWDSAVNYVPPIGVHRLQSSVSTTCV